MSLSIGMHMYTAMYRGLARVYWSAWDPWLLLPRIALHLRRWPDLTGVFDESRVC